MESYLITWEIDVDADSPLEAVKQAREIQLEKGGQAVVFTATLNRRPSEKTTIDLLNY